MRQYFLGIDIGTQSACVALVDQNGNVPYSFSSDYPTDNPRPGWAEQDPEDWWSATVQGIRRVITSADIQPGEILAVGVDTQMHACIPLDREGNLLSHRVQLWCDKRAAVWWKS